MSFLASTVIALTLAFYPTAPVAASTSGEISSKNPVNDRRSKALKRCNDDYNAAMKKINAGYKLAVQKAKTKRGKERSDYLKLAEKGKRDALVYVRKAKSDCIAAAPKK